MTKAQDKRFAVHQEIADGHGEIADVATAQREEKRRELLAAAHRPNAQYDTMLALRDRDPAAFAVLLRGNGTLRIGLATYEDARRLAAERSGSKTR